MANIKDVARLAGVSISTASRVVRGEGDGGHGARGTGVGAALS